MLSHGQVLNGSHGSQWRVNRKVGEGRCCEVYLAEIVGENVQGAVRLCKPGYDVSKKELYILKDIRQQRGSCPNLVSVIDTFDNKGSNVVVQELLDLDLFNIQQMAGGQGMSLYLIQTLLKDLMAALLDLHSCGYVHADIKPSNLMWSQQNGRLKLIDFGLSFHGNQQVKGQVQSRSYRAPEVSQIDQPRNGMTSSGHSLHVTGQQVTQGQTGCQSNSGGQQNAHLKQQKDRNTRTSAGQVISIGQGQSGKVNARSLTTAIDMWSVGCLLHWMYSGQKMSALKPDGMTICDQCKVVDTTSKCEHRTLVETTLTLMSQDKPRGWSSMMDLITRLIQCVPENRLSAVQVLEHEFLHEQIAPDYVDLLVLPMRVVRLLNVIQDRDLSASQEDFDDLMSDIRLECEKYGAIESCHIPKGGRGRGKAYLLYERAADAVQAFEKLNGREFDGQTVITSYFPIKCLQSAEFF